MKQVNDMSIWQTAVNLTPTRVTYACTREEAAKNPGNAVKSLIRDSSNGFPVLHGCLVAYSERFNLVVVRSHGSPVSLPGTVWYGTIKEYERMWEVD